MAKNQCLVLLGYEDDPISEKHQKLVDFTTNKVGGRPVRIFSLCDLVFIVLLCRIGPIRRFLFLAAHCVDPVDV